VNKEACLAILAQIKGLMSQAKHSSDQDFINHVLLFEEKSRKLEKELEKVPEVSEEVIDMDDFEQKFQQMLQSLNEMIDEEANK
jgi:hypothetical protein